MECLTLTVAGDRAPDPRERASAEQLLSAWNETLNTAEVGRRCGISKNSVRKRLIRLGVDVSVAREARRVWSDQQKSYVRRYYKRLATPRIAAKVGKSTEQVHGMARILGLATPRERTIADFDRDELRLVLDDFKKSKLSVQNFCNQRGHRKSTFSPVMAAAFGKEYEAIVEANWPKNTWYVRGRRVELAVRKELEAKGYPHVVRSFRSRGVADLTAVGRGGTLLVQVKRGGYVAPVEHDVLWELAQAAGATPVLAGMPDGRNKRYWVLTDRINEYRCPAGHLAPATAYAKSEACPHCGGAIERIRTAKRNYRPLQEINLPWSPLDQQPARAAA